jgi:hypothetical protein
LTIEIKVPINTSSDMKSNSCFIYHVQKIPFDSKILKAENAIEYIIVEVI